MAEPNWIELAGVVNMRDLGGLTTERGEVVQARRLLRSDNLQDLPADSVRTLVARYGLTDVVDLRTDVEVVREGEGPLRALPEVRHHHLTLYREDTDESGIPAAERSLPWERGDAEAAATRRAAEAASPSSPAATPPSHDEFWSQHYLSYLDQRPDSIVAALRAVADGEGAVVVHCAAGKDRTGTVVGVALKAVGVPDEEIEADYAASAERVPRILDRLRQRPAYAANLRDKSVAQQSPTTDTMRLLLDALENRLGGVHAWLAGHGFDADDVERLRRKLLAPDAHSDDRAAADGPGDAGQPA
ncbi:tyrosine-protein phosphatase [Terracoccus luteus]|uniref:Protein tyrosine/serine phosphatase n=1 Tax=Terracoccus luteus TaxID=53356 RepID=A0A839PSW5_9MICO|nr:tyrosine-protein phosphatase [Terracoccus luteus]MBB2985085.1 protein tyrosine/serine phosphatase [Terracoccus luteus]MCP2170737.1 protein tyrosine/serine phosphatase [Terracoccus luteus]